jgi:hypothetical protein
MLAEAYRAYVIDVKCYFENGVDFERLMPHPSEILYLFRLSVFTETNGFAARRLPLKKSRRRQRQASPSD